MALIIKCRKCAVRIPEDAAVCPQCGSVEMRFIIDYWPRGRRGGRKQLTLRNTKTAAEAKIIEADFRATSHAAKRQIKPEDLSRRTVAELFPDYLAWYRLHRAENSWRDVTRTWDYAMKDILGDYKIGAIGNEHFALFQSMRKAGHLPAAKVRKSRRGKIVSNRTVNKELDYFSGFVSWCRRDKKIDIPEIQYERLPYKRPLPIVLSPEEVAAILSAAESEPLYHAFFLCLYTLGLRISEARNLRESDFDFANRSVRMVQKGGSWKILPLNDQVIAAVKGLIEARANDQRKKKKTEVKRDDEYVFKSDRTGEPIARVEKAIARICARAGVTKKVTAHLFRHSIATHLLGADVNLRTIQQYLGHTKSTTTEFYTHVAMAHLRQAQDMIPKAGAGATDK